MYSSRVDTKLADLVAQSTVASLSVAHQQGLLSSQLGHGNLEQAIGPNHCNVQVQFGQQQNIIPPSTTPPAAITESTNQVSASSDEGTRKSWNSRLEELKSYKQAHGHCNVPQIHEGGLGTCIILKCRLDVDYPGREPNFK